MRRRLEVSSFMLSVAGKNWLWWIWCCFIFPSSTLSVVDEWWWWCKWYIPSQLCFGFWGWLRDQEHALLRIKIKTCYICGSTRVAGRILFRKIHLRQPYICVATLLYYLILCDNIDIVISKKWTSAYASFVDSHTSVWRPCFTIWFYVIILISLSRKNGRVHTRASYYISRDSFLLQYYYSTVAWHTTNTSK
jgi:hypothetical protein